MKIRELQKGPPSPQTRPPQPVEEEPPQSEEEPPESEELYLEEVDLSDGQRKALTLVDKLRKLNNEMDDLLKSDPPKMTEFMDKESKFSEVRQELHELIVQDDSILEEVVGASIVDERKALVDWFLELRTKAYGVDIGDWNKPASERNP